MGKNKSTKYSTINDKEEPYESFPLRSIQSPDPRDRPGYICKKRNKFLGAMGAVERYMSSCNICPFATIGGSPHFV